MTIVILRDLQLYVEILWCYFYGTMLSTTQVQSTNSSLPTTRQML